ncbi:Putative polyhydroxyalkanoic acid system protein (PHA_gran_rgn) [Sphingomonas gellani]|uniref:Putative polyhydroxyalkanoic acid system protein (PHA_gran_rgn) n=1 Tax=Sphingomonas gellani TaxID=1166340 RepID=A0A1H8B5U8_9SPHN|nr:polyhydroxyalkanoic acid system family protein [Sphingomonas gellani]SEM78325.1 Putative polyhydroxyalkanoic acid system protein (PHA_gran_rgn) [Sphingomonas gellani]
MSTPITLDIPHKLGKEAVRQRLDGGIGRIGEKIPGGAAVQHRWEGDTMYFTVQAMGQSIRSELTVFEDKVHAMVDLPALLGLFAGQVRALIEKEGPKLLK